MKTLYTFLSILLLACTVHHAAKAQACFADPQFVGEPMGLHPVGPLQMDCSGLSASKTFVSTADTMLVNAQDTTWLVYDMFRIDSVGGLPPGLTLESDVINTATPQSPYGYWTNPGTPLHREPVLGCISIVGSASAWAAASTGGTGGNGVYTITLRFDAHLDTVYGTSPTEVFYQMFSLFQGSWMGAMTMTTGGSQSPITMQLRVNESACNGDISISAAVTGDDTNTPLCDGAVDVTVYYGTPPYSFVFSTGDTATNSVDSLCPGVYTVNVSDANGASGSYQFAVPADTNVYSNVLPGVPSWVDTLFTTVPTCDLDFNLPVDSFHISSAYAVGTDTTLIYWVVYQDGAPYTVVSYYPYLSNDPYVYSLIIYCQNGRSQTGVFQLFQTLDLMTLGVRQAEGINGLTVFPNPGSGKFNLQMPSTEEVHMELYDIAGKLLQTEKMSGATNYPIHLFDEPVGTYILKVSTETAMEVRKLIKQ